MFCCFVHSSPHFTTALVRLTKFSVWIPEAAVIPRGVVLPSRGVSFPVGVCPLAVSFPVGVCPLAVSFPVGVCPLAVSFPVGCLSCFCVLPSRGVSSCCVLPSRGVSSCCVLPSRGVSFPVGVCPSQSGCVLSSRCVSSCCVLPSRVCVLLLCPSQSGVCPLAVSFPVGLCPLAVSFPVGCVSSCCVLPSRFVSSCCVLPSRVCVLIAVSFPVGRTESPRKFTFCPPTAARHSGRESAPRSVHRAARSSSTVRAAWRSQHLLHTV